MTLRRGLRGFAPWAAATSRSVARPGTPDVFHQTGRNPCPDREWAPVISTLAATLPINKGAKTCRNTYVVEAEAEKSHAGIRMLGLRLASELARKIEDMGSSQSSTMLLNTPIV